jgi:hypothetical protein
VHKDAVRRWFCGPSHSGQGVYQALVSPTRGVPPSVSKARNLSSGVFVDWQRYGDTDCWHARSLSDTAECSERSLRTTTIAQDQVESDALRR